MMNTLYGIKNCDTVKKARRWLDENAIAYRFHDLRTDGLEPKRLQGWISDVGWETLLNRRGTTWRQLPESEREGLDPAKAARLMLAQPTLIKRPVLITGKGQAHVGFKPADYEQLFGTQG